MFTRLGRVGYHLPVSSPVPLGSTFDEIVATFDADLVSYWKFRRSRERHRRAGRFQRHDQRLPGAQRRDDRQT